MPSAIQWILAQPETTKDVLIDGTVTSTFRGRLSLFVIGELTGNATRHKVAEKHTTYNGGGFDHDWSLKIRWGRKTGPMHIFVYNDYTVPMEGQSDKNKPSKS